MRLTGAGTEARAPFWAEGLRVGSRSLPWGSWSRPGPARCASQVGASPLWSSDLRPPSRVHITEATLNHLDKAYEVEDGQGQQRDPYLKEMNIRTYLVIDPRVRVL